MALCSCSTESRGKRKRKVPRQPEVVCLQFFCPNGGTFESQREDSHVNGDCPGQMGAYGHVGLGG